MTGTPALPGPALLQVRGLVRVHRSRRLFGQAARVEAVSGVDLDLHAGSCLALVGESGSGKSSLARAVLQLDPPTAGSVNLDGTELVGASRAELRRARARLQVVFQDPYSSLNPQLTVGRSLVEPLRVHRRPVTRDVLDRALNQVGLRPEHAHRYPHELSGGQRQRVALARALVLEPDVLILDEPLSALDVSIQAGLVHLLSRLRAERGVAMLFIGHDLAVVRHVSDRVAVMYRGRFVEVADTADIFSTARHPYTRALLAASPDLTALLAGTGPPVPVTGPRPAGEDGAGSGPGEDTGCRYRQRCPLADAVCAAQVPPLTPSGAAPGHLVACHHPHPPAP